MKEIIILFFATVVGCFADPVPKAPAQLIDCKDLPRNNVFACVDKYQLFNPDFMESCKNLTNVCETTMCYFNNAGFITDNKINKAKIREFYDAYTTKNKDWTTAVTHLKADCLGAQDLPTQGITRNCPSFDIITCAHSSFLKHALASQWTNTPECQKTKSYFAICPFCPEEECLNKPIAPGTCNACKPH